LLGLKPLAALWQTRIGKALLLAVFLLGLLVHIPAAYFYAEFWNCTFDPSNPLEKLWSWSDAPFLYPLHYR
jgi:hypothetical protein